jgi:hypothetical protein
MELHQAPDQPFAVPVTRRSPEWGWLEYLLHASCAWECEKLGRRGRKIPRARFYSQNMSKLKVTNMQSSTSGLITNLHGDLENQQRS